MRPLHRPLLAVFLALATAAPLAAQPVPWVPLDGPRAARLVAAAVSGDGTPFTVSDLVIHRYDRGEGEWEDIASTFTGSFLDVAGGPGREAWAGTGGVFHVFANGTWDWFFVRTGHEGIPLGVERVAVGPDGTVYVTGLSVDGGGQVQEGGFRSTNAGQSWPEMTVAPASMAFVGTTAYAGTLDGVFRSSDRGASWVPAGLAGQPVLALAASGTRLAAATDGGLWTSTDGATWAPSSSLAGVVALAASDGGAVWAATPDGLYRSSNGGASWPATPAFFAGRLVDDVAAAGPTVLALVERVPFLSTDGGQTWSAETEGLGLRNATTLLAAGGVLAVAAIGSGPFRSTDGGATWATWTEGLASPGGLEFAADAASGRAFLHTRGALYRATLAGGPWTRLSYPGEQLVGIAFDAGRLFATVTTLAGELRLLRSTDGGQTWAVAFEQAGLFLQDPAAAGGVVALVGGSFSDVRLLVSADGGQTWLNRPHPTAEPFSGTPPVFVDSTGALYVGDVASSRLRRSTDLGATWETLGPAGSDENRVLSLLAEPGLLCAGTARGVYCSADDGASFQPASDGLPPGQTPILALAHDDARYVALTGDDGLFVIERAAAVTVDVEPASPPVVIPAGGGAFAFTLTLTNTTALAQTVRVSTAVEGPVSREPVLGPRTVTLPAGAAVTRTLTQQVPAAAPAGAYTYRADVRLSPGTLLDTDAFVVVKEALAWEESMVAPEAAGPAGAWRVSGWDEATASDATGPLGAFALSEVVPNPFASAARLTLDVAEAQAVRVEVYDALGRRVAVLHDGALAAGAHAFVLDGSALPSGVYVVRATGETFTATRRGALAR